MDGLNVYLVSKAVRERGIAVALSGQGGDEVFGGYPSFAEVPKYMRALRAMRLVPHALRPMIAKIAGIRSSVAAQQKLADMLATDGSAIQLALARRRVLSSQKIAHLGFSASSLGLDPSFQSPGVLADLPVSDHFPIHSISIAETHFYMGNMLLRDCDANGMAHSLEIRVPFLDQRVIDLFMSVPRNVRLPDWKNNKHLLRKGFADLLSQEIISQPKVGFILPIKRWMTGPLSDMCVDSLDYLKQSGIVASVGVDRVWSAFLRDPESPMWSRAWTLVVLGAYAKRNHATADAPPAQPIWKEKRNRSFAPMESPRPTPTKSV
jgi:asparagine synthase (glutamine-hydrolysing)